MITFFPLFTIFRLINFMFIFLGARFQIRYEPEDLTRERNASLNGESSLLKSLPSEILMAILDYVDPMDLVRNVAAVSKRFFYLIRSGVAVNRLDIASEHEYAHADALCKSILPNSLMSLNLSDINTNHTADRAVKLLEHMGSN